MAERVMEIAQGLINHMQMMTQRKQNQEHIELANSLKWEQILENIFVYRVYDYTEQLACVKGLPNFLQTHPRVIFGIWYLM